MLFVSVATAYGSSITGALSYHICITVSCGSLLKYLFILKPKKGNKMNRAISLPQEKNSRVPLLGTVTAGQPILAVEEVQGYVPYQGGRYPAGELFALHVRGESMIEAGIFDGDIIIVHKTPAAHNGEIVVAL